MQGEVQGLLAQNQQLQREAEDLRTQALQAADDLAFLDEYGEEESPGDEDTPVALDELDEPDSVDSETEALEPEEEALDLMALLHLDQPLPRIVMSAAELAQSDPVESSLLGQDENNGTAADPEQAARAARQRAATERARQELLNYLNELSQASTDPVEQERLAALADYYDANFDLRREMQQAETDAQREELREALRQNVGEMNAIMRAQQSHMLHQVARQFGVSGPARQRRFTNTLRETYQSPFFSLAAPRRAPK
jgi:hypothetical protein